jgi:hypothetical protein
MGVLSLRGFEQLSGLHHLQVFNVQQLQVWLQLRSRCLRCVCRITVAAHIAAPAAGAAVSAPPRMQDVGVLSRLRRLTHLDLAGTQTSAAGAALLGAIRELTALKHLDLTGCLQWTPAAAGAGQVAAAEQQYAALAASSRLTYLALGGCRWPPGVWTAWFPSAQQQRQQLAPRALAGLRSLSLVWCVLAQSATHTLADLVACCPLLQDLSLHNLPSSLSLAALAWLTQLTRLRLGEDVEEAGLASLAELTGVCGWAGNAWCVSSFTRRATCELALAAAAAHHPHTNRRYARAAAPQCCTPQP